MEFQTSIMPSILGSALTGRIEEDAAAHRLGFSARKGEGNLVSVTVIEAMRPQNNLMADVTWEARENGSHVSVAYRKPHDGEVEPKGLLAPLLAYITMMVLVGAVMWGVGFGLLCFMMSGSPLAPWLAFIAPVCYLVAVVIASATSRVRARHRFERLMRDIFDENVEK